MAIFHQGIQFDPKFLKDEKEMRAYLALVEPKLVQNKENHLPHESLVSLFPSTVESGVYLFHANSSDTISAVRNEILDVLTENRRNISTQAANRIPNYRDPQRLIPYIEKHKEKFTQLQPSDRNEYLLTCLRIAYAYNEIAQFEQAKPYLLRAYSLFNGEIEPNAIGMAQRDCVLLTDQPIATDHVGNCVTVFFGFEGKVAGAHIDVFTDPASFKKFLETLPMGVINVRIYGGRYGVDDSRNAIANRNIALVLSALADDPERQFNILSSQLGENLAPRAICAYPDPNQAGNFYCLPRTPGFKNFTDIEAIEAYYLRDYVAGVVAGMPPGSMEFSAEQLHPLTEISTENKGKIIYSQTLANEFFQLYHRVSDDDPLPSLEKIMEREFRDPSPASLYRNMAAESIYGVVSKQYVAPSRAIKSDQKVSSGYLETSIRLAQWKDLSAERDLRVHNSANYSVVNLIEAVKDTVTNQNILVFYVKPEEEKYIDDLPGFIRKIDRKSHEYNVDFQSYGVVYICEVIKNIPVAALKYFSELDKEAQLRKEDETIIDEIYKPANEMVTTGLLKWKWLNTHSYIGVHNGNNYAAVYRMSILNNPANDKNILVFYVKPEAEKNILNLPDYIRKIDRASSLYPEIKFEEYGEIYVCDNAKDCSAALDFFANVDKKLQPKEEYKTEVEQTYAQATEMLAMATLHPPKHNSLTFNF